MSAAERGDRASQRYVALNCSMNSNENGAPEGAP
jgi:hypothetical protein